jgi:hypothetical protein
MVASYERKAKKIASRRWQELRAAWLAHVLPDGYPEGVETTEVRDLPHLLQEVHSGPRDHPRQCPMVDGLPPLVLAEAVILLQKAVHVLGACQVHVGVGMCSWSLASGYQSAVFAAHAILRLLRVATLQLDRSHHVLDLWPETLTRRSTRGDDVLIITLDGPRLEHRPLWGLLLRLLRVAEVPTDIWPTEVVSEVRDVAVEDFAYQRNTLHYQLQRWPLPDLRECLVVPGFGVMSPLSGGCLDPEREDFSVRLGVLMVRLALGLLVDLASAAPALMPTVETINRWLQGEHYRTYRASTI